MSGSVETRRGQPLLFLGLLLAGWCLLRVVTWHDPWPHPLAPGALPKPFDVIAKASVARTPAPGRESAEVELGRSISAVAPILPAPERALPLPVSSAMPATTPLAFEPGARAAGHTLLWAAALAILPVPRAVAQTLTPAKELAASLPEMPAVARQSLWRSDGWIVLRPGVGTLAPNGPGPQYGGSQAGALVSFSLAPGSDHRPALFARASRALGGDRTNEAAVGLRVRPVSSLPIDAHFEARTQQTASGTVIRPAAFLAGGLDNLDLPLELEGRAYGQAGFVGGRDGTLFGDGAAVVDRRLADYDLGNVSAGAGAWGGAQKGAARLDVGPSVRLDLRLGELPARIEADYRMRIAGNAEPGSGFAITIASGF